MKYTKADFERKLNESPTHKGNYGTKLRNKNLKAFNQYFADYKRAMNFKPKTIS